jgi:O-methyltransferase
MLSRLLKALGLYAYRIDAKEPYTANAPNAYPVFTPWCEPWFLKLYEPIRERTVCRESRAYMLYRFAQHALTVEGDWAECGVYKGGTAYLLGTLLNEHQRSTSFHLFDTFTGMTEEADADPSLHKQGDFSDNSVEGVRQYLAHYNRYDFHPGFIPDSFNGLEERNYAFVHIDVDLYEPTVACCNYFYPRLNKGAILIFDDYGFPQYSDSEKKAVDEFFSDKPEEIISLGTSQAMIIKQ